MNFFFVSKILNFFDYFHKKKIIKKITETQKNTNIEIILDIGGHRGESIELFLKNLNVQKIYSFEPSELNFKFLLKTTESLQKKFKNTSIFLENFAVGNLNKNIELNYLNETSSSTIRSLNVKSKYFQKKEKYFGKLINKKYQVKQIEFKDYLKKKNINRIDLLKIDTEGYELEVLRGLKDSIKNVSIILFEHHYDDMVIKDYTFSDIHDLLIGNGFQKIYKIKMPFRKSFDYIYKRIK